MKMNHYFRPRSVKAAIGQARKSKGNFIYLGGGTDILLHRKQNLEPARNIIDLDYLSALRYLRVNHRGFRIGAMTTIEELITFPEVRKNWPLLVKAGAVVATPVIRKTATVGGNLLVRNRCSFYNQSEEWRQSVGSCLRDKGSTCQITGSTRNCYARNVSDLAPALIALGAVIALHDGIKTQKIPLEKIYLQDGLNPLAYLTGGILLTEIEVPKTGTRWWFQKLRLRGSLDFTSLTVAGARDQKGKIRIVVNGMSPSPVLVAGECGPKTLEIFQRQARKKCQTIENDLFSRKYRREMMALYLRQCYQYLTENPG